jgi:hypothetical protein
MGDLKMGDSEQADRHLQLARINAHMEVCQAERRALGIWEEELLDRKIAVSQEILLEEKILQQRAWEIRQNRVVPGYHLVADPSAGPWPAVDEIIDDQGPFSGAPVPVTGGETVHLYQDDEGDYLLFAAPYDIPDMHLLVPRVLNLTVSGMVGLESEIQRELNRLGHPLQARTLLQGDVAEKEGPVR